MSILPVCLPPCLPGEQNALPDPSHGRVIPHWNYEIEFYKDIHHNKKYPCMILLRATADM